MGKGRRRGIPVQVYLLPEEYEVLEVKAAEAGLTRSDLLRRLILFGSAAQKSLFTKEDADAILFQLNRIGNNLNQIAWRANTLKGADKATLDDLSKNYDDILSEFERLVME